MDSVEGAMGKIEEKRCIHVAPMSMSRASRLERVVRPPKTIVL